MQGTLFDPIPGADVGGAPRDEAVEGRRLNAQCRAIIERLRQGPASNAELAEISLKYTARISDCRQAGHQIICFNRDYKTGEAWYRLVSDRSGLERTSKNGRS